VGTGYVGLVSAACLAHMGHFVFCADADPNKIAQLQNGLLPIYEPKLDALVKETIEKGNLVFTTDIVSSIKASTCVFITVGTPQGTDGLADTSAVFDVAQKISQSINGYKLVIIKSTVPVGTTKQISSAISNELRKRNLCDLCFDVVFCPEFLQESRAVEDFMHPHRIVLGVENMFTKDMLNTLFLPFVKNKKQLVYMRTESAEVTKYTANAMLATRISFMNEMARYCEKVGADIEEVELGVGSDPRIGPSFLSAGVGYGGSCLPKDMKSIIVSANQNGVNLSILKAVDDTNTKQLEWFETKIHTHFSSSLCGLKFAVWGLSFKPYTDDIREAPAIKMITWLLKSQASVCAFDPVAIPNTQAYFGEHPALSYADDPYLAVRDADVLLLLTEWPLFKEANLRVVKKSMKTPVVFDGRNQFIPNAMKKKGFVYFSVGRNT